MNKNKIIASIIQSLQSHKDYVEYQCEKDLELAMNNSQFADLENKRKRLIQEIALKEFEGENTKEKHTLYNNIVKKLERLASNMKLNPYSPTYNCSICRDTGMVNGSYCSCVKKRVYETIKSMSGIDNKLSFSFSNHDSNAFNGTPQKELIDKLYNYLQKYANNYPNVTFTNLILCGGTGTGKTCALSALGNEILNKGYIVNYITAFDMHNAFMKYHTASFDEKFIHMDNLLEPDLLILDDLGTEPIFKNVTLEYLYLILSERTRMNKSTCFSTNLSPENILTRYGERIFSRLLDKRNSRLINMNGKDLRLRK